MIFVETMEGGFTPKRSHDDDGGFDLLFASDIYVSNGDPVRIGMKVKILLPLGWTGLIRPRSSAYLTGLDVNGTIDRYTGEISLTVHGITNQKMFKKGQSIAQLIPVWTGAGYTKEDLNTLDKVTTALTDAHQIKVVDVLDKTPRGCNGFGSTGKH